MLKINNYSDSILDEISFHLPYNKNIIILGANGAGKSTFAKLLCGLTFSTLALKGKALKEFSSKERTKYINYVPAKLEIFDEYICLKEYLDLSKIHSHISTLNMLKLLEVLPLQNKPCQHLSSGEQQLAMLASAVLHNAQITIFDEPTANLDPQKSKMIFFLLKSKLFQQKVIITHDLNLAYHLKYDIIYMNEGKIVFQGSSNAFFKDSNLAHFFGDSIKKIQNYIVGNL